MPGLTPTRGATTFKFPLRARASKKGDTFPIVMNTIVIVPVRGLAVVYEHLTVT